MKKAGYKYFRMAGWGKAERKRKKRIARRRENRLLQKELG